MKILSKALQLVLADMPASVRLAGAPRGRTKKEVPSWLVKPLAEYVASENATMISMVYRFRGTKPADKATEIKPFLDAIRSVAPTGAKLQSRTRLLPAAEKTRKAAITAQRKLGPVVTHPDAKGYVPGDVLIVAGFSATDD